MKTYCPSIQPVAPAVKPTSEQPTVEEPIAAEEPTYSELFEQAEEIISNPIYKEESVPQEESEDEGELKLTFEDIDNTYKAPILRQLCEDYGIAWRDIRGKGKHMLKTAMIQALMAEGAF
jgi:hypothetical protein